MNSKAFSVRADSAERTRVLPGDHLIPDAVATLTHSITIHGSATDVWPWLAQMGAGSRAGWYSYDFLDNGRQPSARRIVPELQRLEVGMVFSALPGVSDGFTLMAFEPERFLVLAWVPPNAPPLVTWTFALEEAEPGSTRLIVRARDGPGYEFHGLPRWLATRIVPMIHFIMQRKQLLGIASRVEGRAAA